VFLYCREHACDKFWVKVFEDLAVNKMPAGVYLARSMLYFKNKSSNFIKLEDDVNNGKHNHDIIYTFLHDMVGIMSPEQKIKTQLDFETIESDQKENRNNWSDIKKKTTKDLLIELYAIEMKNTHNLSLSQAKYLVSVISMAIMFKSLSANDIIIEKGRIKSINQIKFSNRKMNLDFELYNNEENINYTNSKFKKTLISLWEKYLSDLSKFAIDVS
jgi:hypothetical protein